MKRILYLSCFLHIFQNSIAQNVGIGINSPVIDYKLHVHENINFDVNIGMTNRFTGPEVARGIQLRLKYNEFSLNNHEPGGSINFLTEGLDRLTITSNGNVGIGTLTPEYQLDVANRMRVQSGGNALNTAGIWYNDINNTRVMGFIGVYDNNNIGFYGAGTVGWGMVMNTANGNVGIGTTSPTQKLQVAGNICATGTIASCSDIRYKKNIHTIGNTLNAVMNLHPIYYHWKKEFNDKGFSDKRQIGFSAQEVEKYFPEMVLTDNDGYKAVDYSRMTPVLLQAVKEQQKIIEGMQQQINELKKK